MSDTKTSGTYVKDNEAFVFFVGRTHKIASAIYLVTDLFDVREPLRWSLRENVLDVVSRTASMLASNATSPSSFVSVKHTIEEVLFMIETAGRSRLVSKMNRDILFREIQSFAQDLDAYVRETGSVGARTLEAIFSQDVLAPRLPERSQDDFSKGQTKGHPVFAKKIAVVRGDNPKRTSLTKKDISSAQKTSSALDRKERIIEILKQKGAVTIKDIASVIPDCSEKTIQRELVDMVASGVVQKKGERRWTTYFL